MLERIRIIGIESAELLTQVLSDDFEVELGIRWLQAALDDLEASLDPTDEHIKEVFTALANLQSKLTACLARVSRDHHPLIENLADRIDIFSVSSPTFMKTLAQIIANQRGNKHLSQSQLAELSGINQAHISRIESGKSKPTMPTVFRICKALDIDPLVLADITAQEFRAYMVANFPAKPALSVSE